MYIRKDLYIRRSMKNDLKQIAKLLRTWILKMTTEAGSGHPTSSLSGVELMSVLLFAPRNVAEKTRKNTERSEREGFFRYDIENPENPGNDRLIFSKGHASPLFYAIWAAAGGLDAEDLMTFRKFGSQLEGHPTRRFPFTEVPTGSLGQGLSVGLGECLALRRLMRTGADLYGKTHSLSEHPLIEREENLPRVYVLLGDSELAEGSVWESAQIAAYYKLGNLVAIVDMNRLGQRGETMVGWNGAEYAKRFEAFGWKAIEVDGHREEAIAAAYEMAAQSTEVPTAIIAKTVKGKGVSFLEDKNGWHGKTLSKEQLKEALGEIGRVDEAVRGVLREPITNDQQPTTDTRLHSNYRLLTTNYSLGEMVATRKVYGRALTLLADRHPNLVALDAEVSNSTYAAEFGEQYPDRFFEMYIAEQNMVSTAVGMSRRGLLPFVSTFGAFFSRAFDQIRMAQYARVPLVCVGSHVGVSIGDDGASQMGLEDIAMFRALLKSTVLYPSDAVSMMRCVELAVRQKGITYIRTTRMETPVLYGADETFEIGGSKTLKSSDKDVLTVIAAGVTVGEALKACDVLKKENISIRVVDAYSVKPIDEEMIKKALVETGGIITVEDHYPEGGLGAAVREIIVQSAECRGNAKCKYASLAVKKIPRSGQPEELLRYEEIDARAIVEKVKELAQ